MPDNARAMRMAHRTIGPLIVRRLRASVHGRDRLPGAGPLILASNHVSYLDNYILSAATPRPPWFLGKVELAAGLFGRLNKAMGMIPIERGKGDWAAIDKAIEMLHAGEIVALFPEGTRSPSGELYKFRSGMARIAAAAGAPVVPVGLRGTRELWPPDMRPSLRRPPHGTVEVRYGDVLLPPQDRPRARRDFTETVRTAVADLSQQTCAPRYAPVEGARTDGVQEPVAPA